MEDSWLGGSGLEYKCVPESGTKDTRQLVGSLIREPVQVCTLAGIRKGRASRNPVRQWKRYSSGALLRRRMRRFSVAFGVAVTATAPDAIPVTNTPR